MSIPQELKTAFHDMPTWGWYVTAIGGLGLTIWKLKHGHTVASTNTNPLSIVPADSTAAVPLPGDTVAEQAAATANDPVLLNQILQDQQEIMTLLQQTQHQALVHIINPGQPGYIAHGGDLMIPPPVVPAPVTGDPVSVSGYGPPPYDRVIGAQPLGLPSSFLESGPIMILHNGTAMPSGSNLDALTWPQREMFNVIDGLQLQGHDVAPSYDATIPITPRPMPELARHERPVPYTGRA